MLGSSLTRGRHAVNAWLVGQVSGLCWRCGLPVWTGCWTACPAQSLRPWALLVHRGWCHSWCCRQLHPSPDLGRGFSTLQPWAGCSTLPSPLDFSHSLLPAASLPLTAPLPNSGLILLQAGLQSWLPPGVFPLTPWGCSVECKHPPWPVKPLAHEGRAFSKQLTSHCTEEQTEAPGGGMVPLLTVLGRGSQKSQGSGIQEKRKEGTPSVWA